jgi:1-acyl-sn-glycerol-3-phosphate acyltransferase
MPDKTASCRAVRPQSLSRPLWRRGLIALMRGFYFRRVSLAGAMPPREAGKPRFLLVSHRNGAIDGYVALVACPEAQFTLSAQLLRHRLLRLMFDGIPIVREKDRQRYGMARGDFADPFDAACKHLKAGGTLAFFPEGSSTWGYRPQAYQAGGVRVVRRLLEDGVTPQVVPLGLFYRQPDGFRSEAELMPGEPVELPPRLPDEHPRHWEKRLLAALGASLDAVSVNCPDAESFARVERLAAAGQAGFSPPAPETETGAPPPSYARAFLYWQKAARLSTLPDAATLQAIPERRAAGWAVPCIAVFCLLLAPVLLVGKWAGQKADDRNTVSFFRFLGGLAAALLWLPVLLVLFVLFPLPMSVASVLAWIGWRQFP